MSGTRKDGGAAFPTEPNTQQGFFSHRQGGGSRLMPHSTEYEFTNLSITVAGIRLDTEFAGTAELAEDTDGEFYVKWIVLAGRQKVHHRALMSLGGYQWQDAKLLLERGAGDEDEKRLFTLLAKAIEADGAAYDHWRSDREAA